MGNRVAGTAFVKADGVQFALRGNLVVSPSKVERSMIAGQDFVHGYMETPRVPFISGDFTLTPDLSIETIDALTNVTVTAQLANGKTYVLVGGTSKAGQELNAHDGQTPIRWEGTDCQELSS